MNSTALRLLSRLGSSKASKILNAARAEQIKPVTSELKTILSKYENDDKKISLIIEDFEKWFNNFIRVL